MKIIRQGKKHMLLLTLISAMALGLLTLTGLTAVLLEFIFPTIGIWGTIIPITLAMVVIYITAKLWIYEDSE